MSAIRGGTAEAMDSLEQAMSRTAFRQSLIANNLSNVNTPGYKRLDIKFERELADASVRLSSGNALPLSRTSSAHIAARPAGGNGWEVAQASDTAMREDGNSVDVEAEMALLAENTLYYQALVREMNNRLTSLRLAITEGRR